MISQNCFSGATILYKKQKKGKFASDTRMNRLYKSRGRHLKAITTKKDGQLRSAPWSPTTALLFKTGAILSHTKASSRGKQNISHQKRKRKKLQKQKHIELQAPAHVYSCKYIVSYSSPIEIKGEFFYNFKEANERTSDCCNSRLSSLAIYTSFLANNAKSFDRSSLGSRRSLDPLLPSPLASSFA